MIKTRFILAVAVAIVLSACGRVSVETTDNFEQVELPDSSVVYLNHNSSLSYDKSFSPRTVKLKGEAFFSVNDGETPFVIQTEDGEEVRVEGTEFFMSASVTGVVVEVESGIVLLQVVGVEPRCIQRGERVDYSRHDNGLHLGHAKHAHNAWIYMMGLDFKKSGIFLKRGRKHRGPDYHHQNHNRPKGHKPGGGKSKLGQNGKGHQGKGKK